MLVDLELQLYHKTNAGIMREILTTRDRQTYNKSDLFHNCQVYDQINREALAGVEGNLSSLHTVMTQ